MYGQIPPASYERLKDVLKEGKVYVIRKFFCNLSKTSFRPVESPYMVQFTKFTAVEEMPGMEENFPFCTYNLTAFEDIPDPSNARFIGQLGYPAYSSVLPCNYAIYHLFLCFQFSLLSLADVIGKISKISDLLPVQSIYQTAASNTRTIILTDLE
jgi:replication factor A1